MAPPRNFPHVLPLEARFMIYRLLLRKAWPIERTPSPRLVIDKASLRTSKKRWDSSTAILGVCKQISDEALSVLYGENTFVVTLRRNCPEQYMLCDMGGVTLAN